MIEFTATIQRLLSEAFDVLYLVIIIGTIIVIVLDNRNPVKTAAWLLVLIFLPYAGLVLYIFFGRSTRKERLINKKSYDKLMQKPIARFNRQPELYHLLDKQIQLMTLFNATDQALPFSDNSVEIYTDGYDKIHSLIKQLYRAKHHIHIQYYIFNNDPVGSLVRDVLIDKARQGVIVRLIYDDVGCWKVPNSFFEQMTSEGIEVRGFLKVRFPLFTSRVNYRNHRKVVVIDGQVGFVGGMNIAERYLRGFSWGGWRDTHLMISGKAVCALQTSFLQDWYFVDRTLITSSEYYPEIPLQGNSIIQVVTSSATGEWEEIMQGFVFAINNARKYLYIQTPYFLPTEPIIAALQTAALSGVDVRVMIPARSDSRLTHFGSCSYLSDMLKAGVKVYRYKKGFLHSKMMVTDDMLSTVGSTNIDFRSFEHNFEINAFMFDAETAMRLRAIFHTDQRNCEQLSLKSWKKRPWQNKAIESIVRLFSPLL